MIRASTPKNSKAELIFPESKGKINSIFIIFGKSINNQLYILSQKLQIRHDFVTLFHK